MLKIIKSLTLYENKHTHIELADGVTWDFLHSVILVQCRNGAEFPEKTRDSPC